MKITAKIVMLPLIAVLFAVVAFSVSSRQTQTGYEIGPVAWSELAGISGGITEAPMGCQECDAYCGVPPTYVTVICSLMCETGQCSTVSNDWEWFNPDGFSHVEYANTGEFEAILQYYPSDDFGVPPGTFPHPVHWENCHREVY